MTIGRKIDLLVQQQEKIYTRKPSFDAWFQETLLHYEDIFTKKSSQFDALEHLFSSYLLNGDVTVSSIEASELLGSHISHLKSKIKDQPDYKKLHSDLETEYENIQMQLEETKKQLKARDERIAQIANQLKSGAKESWWKKGEVIIPIIFVLISGAFGLGIYFGNFKFDNNLIELFDTKEALQDSVILRDNTIKYIRHNSDSALNILSHMPYSEMKLDTLSFRKVQTTIESAGAVLYLNK